MPRTRFGWMRLLVLLCGMAIGLPAQLPAAPPTAAPPTSDAAAPVAHRGLLRHAPENTLENFSACLHLRLGFEFDVRRSSDGKLVCIHDDTLDRTTNGAGPVSARTLSELQQLDAGSWFSPEFRGARIPTIEEVLKLIAAHPDFQGICTVDMKAADSEVEADMVRLAKRHGVLDRLLFIGRTIDHPDVRRRLRQADAKCRTAALANNRGELEKAIQDAESDWAYLRFVPTADEVAAIRAAGKRTIIAGTTVAGLQPENWAQTAEAGVDLVLTDYPLEFRRRMAGKNE